MSGTDDEWRLSLSDEVLAPYCPMFPWVAKVYRALDGAVVDENFAGSFAELRDEILFRLEVVPPEAMEVEDLLAALKLFGHYVSEAVSIWGGDFCFPGTDSKARRYDQAPEVTFLDRDQKS